LPESATNQPASSFLSEFDIMGLFVKDSRPEYLFPTQEATALNQFRQLNLVREEGNETAMGLDSAPIFIYGASSVQQAR
jgi:hypothetical protein